MIVLSLGCPSIPERMHDYKVRPLPLSGATYSYRFALLHRVCFCHAGLADWRSMIGCVELPDSVQGLDLKAVGSKLHPSPQISGCPSGPQGETHVGSLACGFPRLSAASPEMPRPARPAVPEPPLAPEATCCAAPIMA